MGHTLPRVTRGLVGPVRELGGGALNYLGLDAPASQYEWLRGAQPPLHIGRWVWWLLGPDREVEPQYATVQLDVRQTVLARLREATVEELQSVPQVGPAVATSLRDGLRRNTELVDDLLDHVTVTLPASVALIKIARICNASPRVLELWGLLALCGAGVAHLGSQWRGIVVDPIEFDVNAYVIDPLAPPELLR